MKQSANKGAPVRALLLGILCLAGLFFSFGVWRALGVLDEDREARDSVSSLRSAPRRVRALEDGSLEVCGPVSSAPLEDQAAWISIPGTRVSYPVLHGKGNDWYLKHLPDGRVNRNGSIFMDERNDGSFEQPNTIIYGHRMNSGEMFGELHRYLEPEYLAERPEVRIEFPDGRARLYRIVRAYTTAADAGSAAYALSFPDEETLREWKARLFAEDSPASREASGAWDGARVLTLSTCVRGDRERRLVVQAIEEQAEDFPGDP